VALLMALAVSVMAGASGSVAGQPDAGPTVVKVAAVPYLSYGAFFIADEEGYFADHGIRIELVKFATHGSALPTLAQGQIDVAGGSTSPAMINAVARGLKVRAVADRGHTESGSGYSALVVRKGLYDSGEVRSRADLAGRTITLSGVGGMHEFYFSQVLASVGLTLEDVDVVRLGYVEAMDALHTGAVDLAVSSEPLLSLAEERGDAVRLENAGDGLPYQQAALLLFGPTLLEDEPEIGRRFVTAYLQGVALFNRGKTERNIEIIARHTGLDRELLAKCCWPVINADGRMYTDSLLHYQEWLHEQGLVDARVEAEDLIDTRFLPEMPPRSS